jgi:class 3 adenylate cyclase
VVLAPGVLIPEVLGTALVRPVQQHSVYGWNLAPCLNYRLDVERRSAACRAIAEGILVTVEGRTRYAKSGDLHIAYRTLGDGPLALIVVEQWFSNVEIATDVAPLARFYDRLSTFGRVITFDKRGVGLSDPVAMASMPPVEDWMDDLRAVMDAVGSERAAVIASMAGGFLACVFAATYPERTTALVLVDAFARFVRGDGYSFGPDPGSIEDRLREIRSGWGEGTMLDLFAPDLAGDLATRNAWGRFERHSVSPGTALAMVPMINRTDIRSVLPAIRVPTLVLSRSESPVSPEHGRYLAENIPGAKYVEVEGRSSLMWAGDQDALVGEIQHFLTGVRPNRDPDRALATMMFTDIVGSTDLAASVGDGRWSAILAEHNRVVREQLERFRGREVKTTGDGFLAAFDGPARAIRCAKAISSAVHGAGVDVRAGLHTGEVELLDGDLGGIAVHIAARVSSHAGPQEVLVSSTVKDLVVGSGIEFDDRGTHALKGVPGEWRLFAVT